MSTADIIDPGRLAAGEPAVAEWLGHLDRAGEPPFAVTLPAADDLPAELIELAVPHHEIDRLVASLPGPERTPNAWWLLRRCVHLLVRGMGVVPRRSDPPFPAFPALPEPAGPLGRYLYVYAFLATLPRLREYHRAHGVPERVARLTLADLGRHLARDRCRSGRGGLAEGTWLTLHFRGLIYQLGRLQFERTTVGDRTGTALLAGGAPYGPGTPALAVHIPEYHGPMTPTACDASFALARKFFAGHFPSEPYPVAVCHSWLLDGQLAEYLPAGSNIVRFQHRFRPVSRPGREADDTTIQEFVFGRVVHRPEPDGGEPPRGTTLERAVVDHLRAGRHWYGGSGWVPL